MEREVYLWSGERDLILARHDFCVEQMKARVLRGFDNMEAEADRVSEEVYERIGAMWSDDSGDMSVAAETAIEHGVDFYMMLSDLKNQTTLSALASLFHQWEKDFRTFLEKELSRYFERKQIAKLCWQPNIGKLFHVLEECGWRLRELQWFQHVRACRLIVNVYKHGKGRSLDELARNHPQYLKGPHSDLGLTPWLTTPDHEDLLLTENEFDQIANALRQFWVDFPERLFIPES